MILLNQLQLYAKQILNDYDKKKPSVLFKNKINITIEDAYKIQSLVTELRIKRGEKVIRLKEAQYNHNLNKLHLKQILNFHYF